MAGDVESIAGDVESQVDDDGDIVHESKSNDYKNDDYVVGLTTEDIDHE